MQRFHESELKADPKYYRIYENYEELEFLFSKIFYKEFIEKWNKSKELDSGNPKAVQAFVENNFSNENLLAFFAFMIAARPRKNEVVLTDLGVEGLKFSVCKRRS